MGYTELTYYVISLITWYYVGQIILYILTHQGKLYITAFNKMKTTYIKSTIRDLILLCYLIYISYINNSIIYINYIKYHTIIVVLDITYYINDIYDQLLIIKLNNNNFDYKNNNNFDYKNNYSYVYILHHISCIFGYLGIFYYNKFLYISIISYYQHIPSLFINWKWLLINNSKVGYYNNETIKQYKCKYENDNIVEYNCDYTQLIDNIVNAEKQKKVILLLDIITLVLWIPCRFVVGFYMLYVSYINWNSFDTIVEQFIFCYGTTGFMSLFNIFVFIYIIKNIK